MAVHGLDADIVQGNTFYEDKQVMKRYMLMKKQDFLRYGKRFLLMNIPKLLQKDHH